MVDKYFIELQKGKKMFSIHYKHDVVTINRNGCIENTVHIEGDDKDIYWIECLNLLRKRWNVTKADSIPSFDISYTPTFNQLPTFKRLIKKHPCILVQNENTYYYDAPSKYIWENTNTQVYFPKHILDVFIQMNQTIEFCYDGSTIILLPSTLKQYLLLKDHSDFQLAPFYKTYTSTILPIHAYESLWKSIRFLDKHNYPL